jgi:hypothetical protein
MLIQALHLLYYILTFLLRATTRTSLNLKISTNLYIRELFLQGHIMQKGFVRQVLLLS